MFAIVHEGRNRQGNETGEFGLRIKEMQTPLAADGEVVIRLQAAGLNHRDLFLFAARESEVDPLIPGSDGAGVITAVGAGVSTWQLGDEVVINPCLNWDRREQVPEVPEILGGPLHGTFAEYVVVPATQIYKKPAHLNEHEAALLPLSALTAYRALFSQGGLQPGQHVLITGIGGGVATFALLMAKAAGARVTVTSRHQNKLDSAAALGADRGLDSHSDWTEALAYDRPDLVIDGIGPVVADKWLKTVKPGGRAVLYGASSGDRLEMPIRRLFFPQIQMIGTSMGSSEEFAAMLRFVSRYKIKPVIDQMFAPHEITQAFERMRSGAQFGNIGLRHPFHPPDRSCC